MLRLGERRLDFLESKLELIGVKLFGTTAKTVTLQGVDNRLQAFDLGLEKLERIELAGLFKDERTQRINVVRQVRFHEHERSESIIEAPVNRQSAG